MRGLGYGSYDDVWIVEHQSEYRYWSEMYVDYMKDHPRESHTKGAFVQRVRKLGFNRNYSAEQNEWLKANYPDLGAKETYERFCKKFHTKKGFQGFKSHIVELGLKVTPQRKYEADQNNGNREKLPVGTIRKRCRNTEWIMTESGWEPLARYVIGDVPKGYKCVHLDGNGHNNRDENIAVINSVTSAMMTGNNFWSEDPEITKTAIEWCRLCGIVRKMKGQENAETGKGND